MQWVFPRIGIKKTQKQQCEKVAEEIEEFLLAKGEHDKDLEAIDIYHAAETLLRRRFFNREDELDALIKAVIKKNRSRGKYC